MNRRDFIKTFGKLALGATVSTFPGKGLAQTLLNPQSSQKEKKIILCFDGSKSTEKWREVIDFGKQVSDLTGEEAHFSAYANSCYWFSHLNGGSDIGFGGSQEEIAKRIKLTQEFINNGHELGCHTVRHKHGGNWSYQQWFSELKEFNENTANFFSERGNGRQYQPVGFRAPYLEWNNNMLVALKKLGYEYDISPPGNFVREKEGLVQIGVPMYQRNNGGSVLGMDYNWMVSHVSDSELEKMLPRESSREDPLIIALHFSNYKVGSRSYYEVVKQFVLQEARKGTKFPSMIEYVRTVKKKV